MEPGVEQTLFGKFLHLWRGHTATGHAELPKAYIVEENQEDVGCAFRRAQDLGKSRRIGVLIGAAYLAREMKVRPGQRFRGWRWGSRGRSRCARSRLCLLLGNDRNRGPS